MRVTPGPGRVFLRGLLWGPLLGAVVGADVWVTICLATFALPALVLVVYAVVVGAVVGLVAGLVGAGAVALVASRAPVRPGDGAAVSSVACAGIAFDVTLLGALTQQPGAAQLASFAVATVLLAALGGLGGLLVAQPASVSPTAPARRRGMPVPVPAVWSPAR